MRYLFKNGPKHGQNVFCLGEPEIGQELLILDNPSPLLNLITGEINAQEIIQTYKYVFDGECFIFSPTIH